jgi:hypothetical protein
MDVARQHVNPRTPFISPMTRILDIRFREIIKALTQGGAWCTRLTAGDVRNVG